MPGKRAQVTIATNMAGRGTDIKLGEGVAADGGLHIIGTERHESRRIDNQLRGRSGRQGDPGFVALLHFARRRGDAALRRRAHDEASWTSSVSPTRQPIEAGMVSKSIEHAQSKVENHNYEIRKHVLEYDDVMNKQREMIYAERRARCSKAKSDSRLHARDARRRKSTTPSTQRAAEKRIPANGISKRSSTR